MSLIAKQQPIVEELEEEYEPMPLQGLDKAVVLQETKEFHAITVNAQNCIATLTKILFLLANGEGLTQTEATEIFFAITKLFQSDNAKLRRIVYVTVKELSTVADQVFIASASLVKDINSNNDVYRANAIRALRKVTDATMIGPMERYLKQAVVDKNNNVVSAAIVTGIHLAQTQPEMVKRWGGEVSEALKSKGNKVQYHALALLHKLRKSDRISVSKLVQGAQQGPIRSPLALCLLIKLCTELMQEDFGQSLELYKFVSNMTHHASDMVVFEAAKSLCSLRHISSKEVTPAVLVLQLYLTSHKPTLRFAAVRLLNRVATNHPAAVTQCNIDLEALISDPNRNIATLAITALLKTGSEFNIDRLMKQITGFMGDLGDEFKIVVVDAMKIVSQKFPQKFATVLQFLSDALHEEGGADYKRVVVETIVDIIHSNPSAKEHALAVLCEYIEDCEFNVLTQRILFLLGQQGPTTGNPRKYIRYVNNRITLEQPIVRACAVATLAQFAAALPELRPNIIVLLKRAMQDADDEVRDRASFYHLILSKGDEIAIRNLIVDVTNAVLKERVDVAPLTSNSCADVAAPALQVKSAEESTVAGSVSSEVLSLRERMRRIPQLKALGEPFKTCEPIALTEADSEYVVVAFKHMFLSHIVLQVKVTNTMEDKTLRKISVLVDSSEVDIAPQFAIPIESVSPGATEYAYIVFEYEEASFPNGSLNSSISFAIRDAGDEDPVAPDDIEEYPMDDVAINVSDYITPADVGDFEKQWTLNLQEETVDTYSLGTIKSVTAAVHTLIDFFGMFVVGGRPEKVTTKSHVVNMSGFVGLAHRPLVLISGKVFISSENTIALQLAIRGASDDLRSFLSSALVS